MGAEFALDPLFTHSVGFSPNSCCYCAQVCRRFFGGVVGSVMCACGCGAAQGGTVEQQCGRQMDV